MHSISSITDKSYKKLVIQVSLNGLSFCCVNLLSNEFFLLKNIEFSAFEKSEKMENLLEAVFNNNPELKNKYDKIVVLHNNNLCTFVPTALFEEEFLGSYLQYNNKVFETDYFTFDALTDYEMNNVYIPYININNFFIDHFGSFDYQHSNTILVSRILDISTNSDDKKMYVHVSEEHFEIIVTQNKKLLFFNSFDYKTPEDFIYYTLFTAEQLQLNPEKFELEFLGKIGENDELYLICYKYIRNTKIFSSNLNTNNFTQAKNLQHFILLNA